MDQREVDQRQVDQRQVDQRQVDQRQVERFHSLAFPPLGEMFTLARYLAPDVAGAEAATQETYLRAWRDFTQRPDDGVKPWLVAILCEVLRSVPIDDTGHNDPTCADDLPFTWQKPTTWEEPATWDEPPADEAAASAVANLDAAQLRRQIGGLPAAPRETLILKELGRLSYREIAEAMGGAVATVMSRLALAREALHPRSSR